MSLPSVLLSKSSVWSNEFLHKSDATEQREKISVVERGGEGDSQSISVSSNSRSESEVFGRVSSEAAESRNGSNRLEKGKRSLGDVERSDGIPGREGEVELLRGGESSQVPRISLATRISSSRRKFLKKDSLQSTCPPNIDRRKQLDSRGYQS